MTCLNPSCQNPYKGEILYFFFINKARVSVNSWKNHSFTTLTEDSRATLVFEVYTYIYTYKYSSCGKVFRGSSN